MAVSMLCVWGGLRQWHKVSLTLNGPYAHETFLAYEDFDDTYTVKNKLKTWEPRLQDAKKGDPTWRDGKGKAILGALNDLSDQGQFIEFPV